MTLNRHNDTPLSFVLNPMTDQQVLTDRRRDREESMDEYIGRLNSGLRKIRENNSSKNLIRFLRDSISVCMIQQKIISKLYDKKKMNSEIFYTVHNGLNDVMAVYSKLIKTENSKMFPAIKSDNE